MEKIEVIPDKWVDVILKIFEMQLEIIKLMSAPTFYVPKGTGIEVPDR